MLTSFYLYDNIFVAFFSNDHPNIGGNIMPVLIIYGMPSTISQDKLMGLIEQLQMAAGTSLNLKPNEVSVFFPADLVQRGLGEELICFVDGLFEKSERTIASRQRLAESVSVSLESFAVLYIPECCKVEVIVKRFNQDTDGFVVCDPREER